MNAFQQMGYKLGSSQQFSKDELESLGLMIPKHGQESFSFNPNIAIIETGIAGYSVKKCGENTYILNIYLAAK